MNNIIGLVLWVLTIALIGVIYTLIVLKLVQWFAQ